MKTEKTTQHLTSLLPLGLKAWVQDIRVIWPEFQSNLLHPSQDTIMLQNRANESWRVITKLQQSKERATCNISYTDTTHPQHFQLQQAEERI